MMSTLQNDEAEGLHVVLSADKVANEDNRLNESVTHSQILTVNGMGLGFSLSLHAEGGSTMDGIMDGAVMTS